LESKFLIIAPKRPQIVLASTTIQTVALIFVLENLSQKVKRGRAMIAEKDLYLKERI